MKRSRRHRWIVLASLLVAVGGCGDISGTGGTELRVRGIVSMPDGSPAQGAFVEIEVTEYGWLGGTLPSYVGTHTGADGHYSLRKRVESCDPNRFHSARFNSVRLERDSLGCTVTFLPYLRCTEEWQIDHFRLDCPRPGPEASVE
jgi:hypothetical protein